MHIPIDLCFVRIVRLFLNFEGQLLFLEKYKIIPAKIAGIPVFHVEDYLTSKAMLGDVAHEEILLHKDNVMKFF